ncbi:MAG: ABC transporter substrate-binding protein [Chloroflexi bacterium]|nr:MAG: ABC transporter substrate-binding protein [Chloroflexota bacterium]
MKDRGRFLFVLLAAFSVATLAVSCAAPAAPTKEASPTPKPAEEVTTIKVGALHPVSGDSAATGKAMRQALTFAIDEVNAQGGIQSLGGAKIELVYGDTQTKPDVGVSEVERLIEQEGVVMVVGCYNSSVTKPTTQAAERLKTPFLVDIACADEITERGFKWVFRICPKSSWYARDQVDFLKYLEEATGYKIEKVALLHEDTDWGMSVADGQKKYLEEAGYEMVIDVAYPASAADLSTQVSKVKAADPDVVLTCTYLNDAVLIAKEREKQGLTHIPFVDAAGGTIVSGFIDRLGATAEGLFSVLEFSKHAPGPPSEVNERYHEKYGEDLTGNSAHSYVAGWVVADALERAGSTDKEAIRDALAKTHLEHGSHMILPAKVLEFDENGQNPNARMYIVQVQNGELMPVWPPDYAATEVKLP